MERKDLLGINGKIFIGQGQAIEKNAAADVRVLVVGNPCNTNCLIAMNNAQAIPRDRWFAMTRLDENRAKVQLAQKAGVDVTAVTNLAIWGNHSATQYPDFYNAKINGKTGHRSDRATKLAEGRIHRDRAAARRRDHQGARLFLRGQRGQRGRRHRALADHRHAAGDWHSVAVCSDGSYGVEKDLISSFPIRAQNGKWEIVQGVPMNEFSRAKIDATVERIEGREVARRQRLNLVRVVWRLNLIWTALDFLLDDPALRWVITCGST